MATSSLVHPAASAHVSNANRSVRTAKLTKPLAPAQATIQPKPAKKRNRIPPIQRLRVMEKYALGTNQTAIARDENLNRESVGRIVKSAEMEAFTEEIREHWRALCENAVERKQIPHLCVMGRNIRFLKSDLEPFRASFKQEMENG